MSEVLGPIHYLMWEKIGYQEQIVQRLLKPYPHLLEQLDCLQPAGAYDKDLATLIDSPNIHGWLAAAIDVTEARLAFAYAQVNRQEALTSLYHLGKEARNHRVFHHAHEVFEALTHYLLDGMPCDRAYLPQQSADGFTFTQVADVHAHYAQAPLLVDASQSKDNTCSGTHDHDDHEAFELQAHADQYGELSVYAQEAALKGANIYTPYYDYRISWLEGFFDQSGWSVTRINRCDFAVKKHS